MLPLSVKSTENPPLRMNTRSASRHFATAARHPDSPPAHAHDLNERYVVDMSVVPNPFQVGNLVTIVKDAKEERIGQVATVVKIIGRVTVALKIFNGPSFVKRLSTIETYLHVNPGIRPEFEEPYQSHSDSYYRRLTHVDENRNPGQQHADHLSTTNCGCSGCRTITITNHNLDGAYFDWEF
eukprot:scaffold256745_cov55-Attheya_sp.AAC.3